MRMGLWFLDIQGAQPMIKITMKDGAVREAQEGITIQEFVKNFSNSLAKKALAAKLDGETRDLTAHHKRCETWNFNIWRRGRQMGASSHRVAYFGASREAFV